MNDCISTCSIFQEGCTTPLVSPYDTHITVIASDPFTLKANQKDISGYTATVCYSCDILVGGGPFTF